MRETHIEGASGYQYGQELAPDIHWFDLCAAFDGFTHQLITSDAPEWYVGNRGRQVHGSFNVYLIDGSEKSLLFDTGPILKTNEIGEMVDDILDGEDLDYLVVSHPDVDHTGSVFTLMEHYPDLTVLAPKYGSNPEMYYLNDAELVAEGDTLDLGDKTVTFRDARFIDSASTVWMTEETTGAFFVVDWFAYSHLDNECHQLADVIVEEYGLETLLDRKRFTVEHKYNWFPYVDPERIRAHLEYMVEEYDPRILAPTHSQPLTTQVPEFIRGFGDLVEQAIEEGTISGDLVA